MDISQIVMEIILNSGDARAAAFEALEKSKENDFEGAMKSLEEADEFIGKAHEVQTSLIHKEANGEKIDIGVLFIHSQDHLMTSISEKNLITELIEVRKEMFEMKQN